MKLRPARLRVFPNPWGVHPSVGIRGGSAPTSTLDAKGRPCGLCPTDPIADRGRPGRMVGARADATFLNEVLEGEIRNRRQSTAYLFLGESNQERSEHELAAKLAKKEPISLGYTAYYRERLIDGSLIAADVETARAAGVPFEAPETLFPKLSKAAAAAFDAHFDGGGAYELFVSERAKAQPTPAPDAEASTPTEPPSNPVQASSSESP